MLSPQGGNEARNIWRRSTLMQRQGQADHPRRMQGNRSRRRMQPDTRCIPSDRFCPSFPVTAVGFFYHTP